MKVSMKKIFVLMSLALFCFYGLNAQVIKVDDLEKYAKQRYGDKWLDAAANLASQLELDKNKSLTYQQVMQCPGRTKDQIYVLMNYWVTATFAGQQSAITLNDKERGTIMKKKKSVAGRIFRYPESPSGSTASVNATSMPVSVGTSRAPSAGKKERTRNASDVWNAKLEDGFSGSPTDSR